MVFEVVEHTKLYISTKKIVIGGGGGNTNQTFTCTRRWVIVKLNQNN